MTTVEILAPAGTWEALTAAVRSGANAVYLGVGDFNARRNATNFQLSELKDIITYCHIRGVKVHLALNTLVSDAELPAALEIIECGCAFGADAFIIQDLGLARLVHAIAPDMPLHASTQMAVMNAAGFRLLESLGFTRVVLPRELSLKEIQEIREQTSLELELFVHGALCMCVSGQCYLSAMLGGRSGNRGLCAQPCRLPFQAPGGTGHDLSLKDLSIIGQLPALAEAGITSFKIEGRMKRPEYVAAAVTACQNALQWISDPQLNEQLRAVFSRSGFTDGYLSGHRGPAMFGTRQKEDVLAAAPILEQLSALYQEDPQQAEVDLSFTAQVRQPMTLQADLFTEYGPLRATATGPIVAEAQNKAATPESVEKQLRKSGGTGYLIQDLDITLGSNCFLPVSALNELRRNTLDSLTAQLLEKGKKDFSLSAGTLPEELPVHRPGNGVKLVRFTGMCQLPKSWLQNPEIPRSLGISHVIFPVQTPDQILLQLQQSGLPFGVELPRALYGNQDKLIAKIAECAAYGAAFLLVGNLDGVALAQDTGLPIIANFSINAFNSLTINELRALGLKSIVVSAELDADQINALKGTTSIGLFAYGRLPLMLTRNCPIKNGTDCRHCQRSRCLTDRKGVSFPVQCNNGASELLNSRPIYLADKQQAFRNTDFALLYFTTESADTVSQIAEAYHNSTPPKDKDFTRGLYFRGVL